MSCTIRLKVVESGHLHEIHSVGVNEFAKQSLI